MELSKKVSQLQAVDCLSSLPKESIENLASQCEEVNLEPDKTVFEDGEPGESMYIVLSGMVGVFKKKKKIATRGPGEFIGEMALLQSGPRSATARAISDTCLLEIRKDHFHSYLTSNSQALFTVLKTLSDRSRQDLEKLDKSYVQLQVQEKLSKSLMQILDNSTNEIYIFDSASLHFVQTNACARNHIGYSVDELKNMTPADLIEDIPLEELKGTLDLLLNEIKTQHTFKATHRRKDGTTYPVEIRLAMVPSETLPLFVAHVQDQTERKLMEDKIDNITYRDALTGLPNRKYFVDSLNLAIEDAGRSNQEIAVMCLDLDNFRSVNDAMGREAGDLLIKELAQHLQNHFRKLDLVAHAGGDGFLVMLRETRGEAQVTQAAERFIESLKTPFEILGSNIPCTFSIGIARFPDQGITAQDILMQAETALYAAKDKGKNTFLHFDSSQLVQAAKFLDIERGLVHALENDELLLHYQPTVDLKTGKIMGFEALCRWNHPEKGMISPAEFIPVAEKSQLILPIGDWVLKTACQQFQTWQEMGIDLEYIAVNFSGVQFNSENPVPRVSKIMQDLGMNPRHLELEITETVLTGNSEAAIATLQELSDLGIFLAIDDFGTGYSSLTYLSRLPVDTLKIDLSFVKNLQEPTNAIIAKTIVALGKGLNMKTVAEGVETEDQKAHLQSFGCDLMQGYLFSKPLPEEEATRLLQENADRSAQPSP